MSVAHEDPGTGEPIAVVGHSCRLPGARDPEEFWRLLSEGRAAVGEVPAGRWTGPAAEGHRRGGFLDAVDAFDADFFGIGPGEAAAMDPQQRLALELAWEAVERARIAPHALRGERAGVYVGAIGCDYDRVHDRLGEANQSPYTVTGTGRSLIANRVSYLLGLRGPSLTVDCGQSSSLVAVHLACEDLRGGRAAVALAGGVNLNLLPETTEALGRFGALSPDGRCHVFDERANGYVRGEGGAFLVLKPLSAALAAGDLVHCVILGGAVNNDGGGDTLTAPHAAAQTEVIRSAYQRAGVPPEHVRYVELHGTGTPVGDPVEAAALGEALGRARAAGDALAVGSVKTNIGHLEGAAGIAGLLKTVLGLSHRTWVPSLNFERPNPRIALAELGLRVVRTPEPWPAAQRPAVAGVSSFGMGGTNCHLVLAAAPCPADARADADAPAAAPGTAQPPLLLSARSPRALRAQGRRLADALQAEHAPAPADAALSLLRTRSRFEHRAVVFGADRAELVRGLEALAAGRTADNLVAGAAVAGRRAFVFPGQGSQWPAMARALLEQSAVFAERVGQCARALSAYVDFDPLAVLRGAPGAPDLSRPDVVQPALWAVMVSLAQLWRAHGVEPDLVIGHSQGEIAAATVIGALSVQDAARVVALRSRAVRRVTGGGMLSASAAPEQVLARVDADSSICVAAVNGPRATIVSGDAGELARLRDRLEADGLRARLVQVDYASHSPAVEVLREEILDALAPIRPRSAAIPFYSTLTGAPLDTGALDAQYWFRSLRNPVRFADAVRSAASDGCAQFVECSAHPLLVGAIEETGEALGLDLAAVGTLRREDGGLDRVVRSLAEAHTRGLPAALEPYCARPGARITDLPTYPFQRERHWLSPGAPTRTARREAPAVLDAGELSALVAETTAGLLGRSGREQLDPARTFKDLGLDSVGSVELRNRLNAATGLRLPTTALYQYPTMHALTGRLRELSAAAGPAPGAAREQIAPPPRESGEPIAVIGVGCRFPGGVDSPESLWTLVAAGTDAIGPLPADRSWDLDALLGSGAARPGTCATAQGGFLYDAAQFDAAFFGLSPREALAVDPQQRLLLETSWEAMERAGLDPAALRARAEANASGAAGTGVFVGAMAADYGPRLHRPAGVADGHLLTGTAASVASGRLAYTYGFGGPALTVDTACSSSLVALHLAVQSLRRGECSLALAAGVTVMSNPGLLVEFSRQHGLAPDGRAKAFSADANGTAFAEGAATLVLERLSDARRNGRTVLGVIRGTAVNQDGASNGLTAPNGQAQQRVIGLALADAGLEPGEVDAIEAHGTGTALGDPIEADALLATYGRGREPRRPAWLGSVKSNLGHTQAAAGMAGIIKMLLAMRHELLPRTLHADAPTTQVDWAGGAVRLLQGEQAWPRGGRVRRAAVSSFGISGTNAHVILEEPDREPEPAPQPDPTPAGPTAWIISARTRQALSGQARRLADHLAHDGAHPRGVARALAARARFEHRAVVVGDRDALDAGLGALATGARAGSLHTGAARGRPRTAFLFTGQGGQRLGMGRALHAAHPVFARAFDEVCDALEPYLAHPLRTIVWAEPGCAEAALLDQTAYTQPALFAFEVAGLRLLESLGVRPDAVAGHSVGEFAAAHAAGVWSLPDAARLVAARGRLMQRLPAGGAMYAIEASEDEVRVELAGHAGLVDLAAVNGPRAVVVSGAADPAASIAASWARRGRRTRRLTVSHAFHSPLMEPMLDAFAAEVAATPFAKPELACEPALGDGEDWSQASYWVRQARHTVRFGAAVERLARAGTGLVLEVGPGAVLTAMARASAAGRPVAFVPMCRRDRDERECLLSALAESWIAGLEPDWGAALANSAGPAARVDLPTYPFERTRSWLADEAPAADGSGHPLLTRRIDVARDGGLVIEGTVSPRRTPWLSDHVIGGALLLPGTALLECALYAARLAGAAGVGELTLRAPLALPARGGVRVQVAVGGEPDERGRRTLTIHARPQDAPDGEAPWTVHATGFAAQHLDAPEREPDFDDACAREIDLTGAYARLADHGYGYGPAFQGLLSARRGAGSAGTHALVRLPEAAGLETGGFLAHPALLDAALHALVLERTGRSGVPVPFSFTDAVLDTDPSAPPRALRVRLTASEHGTRLTFFDEAGARVGGIGTLALREIDTPAANTAANTAAPAPPVPDRRGSAPPPPAPASRPAPAPAAPAQASPAPGPGAPSPLELVRATTARVLGHGSPDAIDPETPYTELGLDSLAAVELHEVLADETGLDLPTTLMFDRPTVAQTAAYLSERLGPAPAEAAAAAGAAANAPTVPGVEQLHGAITAADPARRARIEADLLALLQRLRGEDRQATACAVAGPFESASDEELFRFIESVEGRI